MKKILLLTGLLFSLLLQAQDIKDSIKQANDAIESGDARTALESVNKVLKVDPGNKDARWLRARALLTANAKEADLTTAINDLNYIISNGGATGRIYNALGVAESDLGQYIYRIKSVPKDAVIHYENSKVAYQKAIELEPQNKQKYLYKIKDADKYLIELNAL